MALTHNGFATGKYFSLTHATQKGKLEDNGTKAEGVGPLRHVTGVASTGKVYSFTCRQVKVNNIPYKDASSYEFFFHITVSKPYSLTYFTS